MKRSTLALSFSLVVSSSVFASSESVNQTNLGPLVEKNLGCLTKNKITASSLDSTSYRNIQFLLSDNYCINSIDSKNNASPSLLVQRNEITDLYNRFYDAYKTLESFEDKVAFVNLFLINASHRYYVTPSLMRYEEDVQVIFYRQGSNGSPVGHVLSLFPNLPFDAEKATQYEELIENMSPTNKKIKVLVDGVITNNKKK